MKTSIISTFVLFVIASIALTFSQQSLRTHPFETKSKLGKHMSKRDIILNELKIPQQIPAKQHMLKNNQLDLNAIISDFQVNENAGPNGATNECASISSDAEGNFIITWVDDRNGTWDIFAQRFLSNGTPTGANFKINDDEGLISFISEPSISVNGSGNFVIIWREERNGNADVYAQRFLSDGTPAGDNFKVNDDEGSAWQQPHSISTDYHGNFIITWQDIRNEDQADIYAQRYSSDGNPLGANFKVNDYVGSAWQDCPMISSDSSGNFVITWIDPRNGNSDVYSQRYLTDGMPVAANFKVNDDQVNAEQGCPSISMDKNGNWNIYAQRYLSDGIPLGANFIVNDNQGNAFRIHPSISSDRDGNFVITWEEDMRNSRDSMYTPDIYAQCFLDDGTPVGVNFKVNNDQGNAWQVGPSISKCRNRNFVIAWRDDRNGNNDIFTQRFLSDGTPVGVNYKVNDDQGSSFQTSPSISLDGSGNFVITWVDDRNGGNDIYAQRYLPNGTPLGNNFRVNDNEGSAVRNWIKGSPSISADSQGNFIITWVDERNLESSNFNYDIYAQLFLNDGTPFGSNFKVNDDEGNVPQIFPSISSAANGNFVITWKDDRDGPNEGIYAQRYLSGGTPVGQNFKVNDSGSSSSYFGSSSISVTGNGDFIITWSDGFNGPFAQRFLSDGIRVGANFKVKASTNYNEHPAISIDGNNNFVITWWENRNEAGGLYAQRYLSDGSPIGNNFKVSDEPITYPDVIGNLSISADYNGNFIIIWDKWSNMYFVGESDIYAQRYLSDGSRLGDNFLITSTSEKTQYLPEVKLWNGLIYNTWTEGVLVLIFGQMYWIGLIL